MSVYAVEELINQTRKLAKEYYLSTKQTLPVSHEIAKFDACKLLNLIAADSNIAGVDAADADGKAYQIKSRAVLKAGQSNVRIGQLNLQGNWDQTLSVLLNEHYLPTVIYRSAKQTLAAEMEENKNPKQQKRGAMSLAKFCKIAEVAWADQDMV